MCVCVCDAGTHAWLHPAAQTFYVSVCKYLVPPLGYLAFDEKPHQFLPLGRPSRGSFLLRATAEGLRFCLPWGAGSGTGAPHRLSTDPVGPRRRQGPRAPVSLGKALPRKWQFPSDLAPAVCAPASCLWHLTFLSFLLPCKGLFGGIKAFLFLCLCD